MLINFLSLFNLIFSMLGSVQEINHVFISWKYNSCRALLLSAVQVVYAVANEGSRLEIPEGPLGRLISGAYSNRQINKDH